LRCELVHDHSNVHVTAVHLPAMNTPQFKWVKSRLPHQGQPVPPIFQPEVAAEAIYWSAHHRRRELWVGGSTYKAIMAQRLAPGLADWYLGHHGYQGQQTETPLSPDRQHEHNLWQPLDEEPGSDHGAHGSFDDRAVGSSTLLQLAQHSKAVAAGLAGIGLGLGLALLRAKHK